MDIDIPDWAENFPKSNELKVIKLVNGISNVISISYDAHKKYLLFGRHPESDVVLDEVSCSRKHAIICYGNGPKDHLLDDPAFWISDLGTQNGSHMNDHIKLQPFLFYLLKNGYFFQFGVNNIKYLVEYSCNIVGVDEDDITGSIDKNSSMKDEKIDIFNDWGQKNDLEIVKHTSMVVNKEPAPPVDDPVQVVKKFYKREGIDFLPEFNKLTARFQTVYDITLILPIEDENNDESNETILTAQGDTKGEALNHVCRMAYELLYSRDLLNKQTTESYINRKKRQMIENDYYDSDEDTFYDRTGSIEIKRNLRIKRNQVESHNADSSLITSENVKSYFDKSVEYISSKKISSRLNELNKQIIRTKSELHRFKNKKENYADIEYEDEAEKQVVISEKADILSNLNNFNDKLKHLIKEKNLLLKQLEHSQEYEKSDNFKIDSIPLKSHNNNINNAKKHDNNIIDEIIKSYTDPIPVEKLTKISSSDLLATTECEIEEPVSINSDLSTENEHKTKNMMEKSNTTNSINLNKNDKHFKLHVNDARDMDETDNEKLIDDSPISWIPQSDNTINYQNNLKNKYGY